MMPTTYPSLLSFHATYRPTAGNTVITLHDIDTLVTELESNDVRVIIRPDDSVDVFPKREYSEKYWAQKKYHSLKYAKLSASIDKELVSKFAEACKLLCVTQVSVLVPILEDTVKSARIFQQTLAVEQDGLNQSRRQQNLLTGA
jgi:hypothetical protein